MVLLNVNLELVLKQYIEQDIVNQKKKLFFIISSPKIFYLDHAYYKLMMVFLCHIIKSKLNIIYVSIGVELI